MASTTGTATEGSDRTPLRCPAGEAEEEEIATPISAVTSTGPVGRGGVQFPRASDISRLGIEATDPDDESRPVTKRGFATFRHRVENTLQRMYADVMGLMRKELDEQYRQRNALK